MRGEQGRPVPPGFAGNGQDCGEIKKEKEDRT
jgi:hypothetical protein